MSVQGSHLVGSRDHGMGGGGGEPSESLCGVVTVTPAAAVRNELSGFATGDLIPRGAGVRGRRAVNHGVPGGLAVADGEHEDISAMTP